MFPLHLRLLIYAALLPGFTAFGQTRYRGDAAVVSHLDDVAKRPGSGVPEIAPLRIVPEHERPKRQRRGLPNTTAPQTRASGGRAAAASPVSYSGFPGLLDNFSVIPPDASGAISPQWVVTMLNTQMTIQSRIGTARANYPITLNAFWSPVGDSPDAFDPRIQYDSAANRWIACAVADSASAKSALLLGVSQTGDPGGLWNLFKINVGPSNWADYPVLGFNGNWVVVSFNLFRVGGDRYQGTSLLVFSKASLFAGTDPYTTFSDNQGTLVAARDLDNRPDSLYFVQAFADTDVGTLRLSRLTGPVGSESFRGGNLGEISIADPWSDIGASAGEDFAPQSGSAIKIDAGDDRLQNCVMRGGTIWCAHTIFLPYRAPTRSSVQWFQIDPATVQVLQRGRIDDASATWFYAYPSIAVNKNQDVLVGFTRFGGSDFASAEFAFRTTADPSGAMQPDVVYKKGEAVYLVRGRGSSSNRWGDFSTSLVDPLDDLTFWTLQEYASTPPAKETGRFGTFWAKITAPSSGLDCNYSLSNATQAVGSTLSNGVVTVTTAAACPWMAASNVPWIVIGTGSPGLGSGTVSFVIASNPNVSATRVGTITVAGKTLTVTQQSQPATVDLAVTAVNAPTSAEAGQRVTIAATINNLTSTPAGPFRVGLYIGAGTSVTAQDTLLASCAIPGLAAQGTVSCTQFVTLPATLKPGRYAIGAIADDLSAISDTNTGNNIRASDFGALTIQAPLLKPVISAQGMVSAASYQGGAVSPGEVVTLFGTNLGPASVQFARVSDAGLVDAVAGGTRVLFDGVPAPMIYSLAGQISVVAPFALEGRSGTQVQVEYLGTRSDVMTVPVAAARPAIFTLNKSGTGPGAILNQDYSVNTPGTPARRSSVLMIYATGGGALRPGFSEGTLAQAPFAELSLPVSVRIGGVAAPVLYAGQAPGIITGVVQINVAVPPEAPAGTAIPIEIMVNGTPSQAGVTVAVE